MNGPAIGRQHAIIANVASVGGETANGGGIMRAADGDLMTIRFFIMPTT